MNGYRLVEMAVYGADRRMMTRGDIFIALHPFSLSSAPKYRHLSLSFSLSLSVSISLSMSLT